MHYYLRKAQKMLSKDVLTLFNKQMTNSNDPEDIQQERDNLSEEKVRILTFNIHPIVS